MEVNIPFAPREQFHLAFAKPLYRKGGINITALMCHSRLLDPSQLWQHLSDTDTFLQFFQNIRGIKLMICLTHLQAEDHLGSLCHQPIVFLLQCVAMTVDNKGQMFHQRSKQRMIWTLRNELPTSSPERNCWFRTKLKLLSFYFLTIEHRQHFPVPLD
jgi:hypothetical protein